MYKLTPHYVEKRQELGVLSTRNLGYSRAARTGKPAYQKNLVGIFRVSRVVRVFACALLCNHFHHLSVGMLILGVGIGLDGIEPVLTLFGA